MAEKELGKIILGITGTVGAGKGEVVSHLVTHHGFRHYSVRSLLTEKMYEAGIAVNRDTMIDFANMLREEHGPRYLFDELYARAATSEKSAIIESVRAVGEVEALKELGGALIAVDADIEKRFERIHGRGSELDNVTFEEFVAQEAREMHSDDPNKQNLARLIEMADFTIYNNDSIEELHQEIDAILKKL